MLDIRWIRDNPEALDRALEKRGAGPESARLISLDEARRAAIGKLEEAQQRRNAVSKEIGKAKAAKDEATAGKLMAEATDLRTVMQTLEEDVRKADRALDEALAVIPNIPLDDVPVGPDETANVEHSRWGDKPSRWGDFRPKEHFEIGEALGGMDFETAAKLSGSRFVVLKGALARMERALGQFMLDLHTEEHGYTEVQPPLLVWDHALFGTAQLPKFADDQFATHSPLDYRDLQEFRELIGNDERYLEPLGPRTETPEGHWTISYHLNRDGLALWNDFVAIKNRFWLIPTAEVPLTNLVRESILDEEAELPLRFTALTPCFRSEAGAAGKDTRGMLRQHQFDKVELVSITTPEQSADEHERMLACAEEVLRRLDLHYRVVTLSTGDMGFAAQKTWDIEVWLPGQGPIARFPLARSAATSRRGACRRATAEGGPRRRQSRDRAKESPALRPHPQRLGRRRRPRADRGSRELPERGRLGHRARSACDPIWAA
jgi:seryl-tRNA synthetase